MSNKYVYTAIFWNDNSGRDVSLYRYKKSIYDILVDSNKERVITFSYYDEDGNWSDVNLRTTITSKERVVSYEEVKKMIVRLELER